jgi:hypothetical protein
MAKTNKRGKSGGGSGTSSKTGRNAGRSSGSNQSSDGGVRMTSTGNRRGGNTSNARMTAKRPRSGSESNAGSKDDGRAQRARQSDERRSVERVRSAKSRTSLRRPSAEGENTGTNHPRGRHVPNPKQGEEQG